MENCRTYLGCAPETTRRLGDEQTEMALLWSSRERLRESKDPLLKDCPEMSHAAQPESVALPDAEASNRPWKLRSLGKQNPVAHTPGSHQIKKRPGDDRAVKPSILIVDDNCDTLWTFGRELLRCGYKVVTSVSGKDAMAMLDSCAFELMITGLKSSRVDGLTLIDHARRQGQAIKAIVTTEFGSRPVRNLCNEKAVTYLEKPVHPEDLVDTIIEILSTDEESRPNGTIAELHWLETLQLMVMCRRSAVLTVSSMEGERYSLFVHNGQIRHAHGEGIEGEEAFFKCVDYATTSFEELPWTEPPHVSIRKVSLSLLREASARLAKPVPTSSDVMKS